MIDNSRHSSSAPEPGTDCRIPDFNGQKLPFVRRRKRFNLRRIRSWSSVGSEADTEILSNEEICSTRKRNELLLSSSVKKPSILASDRLPDSDVIVSGSDVIVPGTCVRVHSPEGVRSLEGSVEKGTCKSTEYPERVRGLEGKVEMGTCKSRESPERLRFFEGSVERDTPERVRGLEREVEKGTCKSRESPERVRFLEGSVERGMCVSYGSISVIGRRREMKDAVAAKEGFISKEEGKYDFFGVYDGHGGPRVAHACRERLHELVIEEVEEEVVDWEKVMMSSFKKMDDEVNRSSAAVEMMGSTAVVAVVGEEELVVANCGDSRAVLFQGGAVVALSCDHKPDRPDELGRIEDCGGKVINWNGQRVLGVLATSRSIGDHMLKPFVISEPEVRVMRRTDKDEFMILASDGLWDVISSELACEIVRRCLDGQLSKSYNNRNDNNCSETFSAHAAALLAELTIARGSRDNVSVIVIELQRFGCSRGGEFLFM